MKKLYFALILLICGSIQAQESLTIENMFDGTFRTRSVRSVNWMNDGQYYSALEENKIIQYDVTTGKAVATLVNGNELEIEHLRYDNIQEMTYEFENPLPQKEYTVVVEDIRSRSFHPFVLEQPSAENNFTATIYLSDFPEHGYSWWEFKVYYIEKSPQKLGLETPWK